MNKDFLDLIPNGTSKILVAPLNWGLGHATRCIPIIQRLLNTGYKVLLGSDGIALDILHREFPQLDTVTLPAYNVQYKSRSLLGIILSNQFNVLKAIVKERFIIDSIIKEHQIDFVISDSRFGLRSTKVPSVIISHQLSIKAFPRILSILLNLPNKYLLNSFDQCWIPDDSNLSLSGELGSSPQIRNNIHIGPLSRMVKFDEKLVFDLAIILSGPEPAREQLESKLITILQDKPLKIALVRGSLNTSLLPLPEHWDIHNLATSKEINQILLQSKTVISRSGYTSIMDYHKLGIKAYLIPTPGQSEQEYLSEYHNNNHVRIKDMKQLGSLILKS